MAETDPQTPPPAGIDAPLDESRLKVEVSDAPDPSQATAPESKDTPASDDTKPAAAAKPDGDTPADGERPKGKKTPEQRIAQAQFDLREAERRERAAAEKAAHLERELAAARQAKPEPKAEPETPAVETPKTFPSYETWQTLKGNESKTYEDYADDRADFRLAQKGFVSAEEVERIATDKAQKLAEEARLAAHRATEAAAAREREMAFTTSLEEAQTKYPDWDETVLNSDLKTNSVMDEYVRRSGAVAGDLIHYLGTHPAECERIAALGTVAEVIEEMALIKSTLKGASASGHVSEREPRVTKAPPPIAPLGSGAHTSPKDLTRMSTKDFMRLRDEAERSANGGF